MKTRQDYVSNSSSCSFILRVRNEGDKMQLRKHKDVLAKYANEVSPKFRELPYGHTRNFESVDKLQSGDFVRIYMGEDNEYNWDYEDPYFKLSDIADELNKGAELDLQFYRDNDAHVTLGDDYKEKEE